MAKQKGYQFQIFGWLIPIDILLVVLAVVLSGFFRISVGLIFLPILYIIATVTYGKLKNKKLNDISLWVNSGILHIILFVIVFVVSVILGLLALFTGLSSFFASIN